MKFKTFVAAFEAAKDIKKLDPFKRVYVTRSRAGEWEVTWATSNRPRETAVPMGA